MRAFLYHPTRPEGQMYDLDGQLQAQLEAEGWVDSPAKLSPAAQKPTPLGEVMTALKEPAPLPASSPGRVLNLEPSAPVEPSPADLRYGKLFDADGDAVHASLTDDDVLTILTDMSREELIDLSEMLLLTTDKPPADSDTLRMLALGALRPHMMPEAISESLTRVEEAFAAAGVDPEIVETQKPADVSTQSDRFVGEDVTAAEMRAELDSRGVAYKARDGKDALAKLLIANPRKTVE